MPGTRPKFLCRLFQFRLTSLFLLTTLVALWSAWELSFIRERRTWVRENAALVDLSPDPFDETHRSRIPWRRSLLGDAPVPSIFELDSWTDDDRAYVQRLFPEATLWRRPLVFGTNYTDAEHSPGEAVSEPSDAQQPAQSKSNSFVERDPSQWM